MVSVATRWLKSLYIIHLAIYPYKQAPTDSADEPKIDTIIGIGMKRKFSPLKRSKVGQFK